MSVNIAASVRDDYVSAIRELLRGNYNDRLVGQVYLLAQQVKDSKTSPPASNFVTIDDADYDVLIALVPTSVYNYDFDVKIINRLKDLHDRLAALPVTP